MPQTVAMLDIRLKRAYEPPADADGVRVLVDRLWPRGLSKANAAIDHWLKQAAPSTELRRWFGHEPAQWNAFKRRYRAELLKKPEAVNELKAMARKGRLTLIFAAHDERHNNAVVLRDMLTH